MNRFRPTISRKYQPSQPQALSVYSAMMKRDALQQFVKLRASLENEKTQLEARLRAVNAALGANDTTGRPDAVSSQKKRSGGKVKKPMSAETKAKLAEAQRRRWAKRKGRGAPKTKASPVGKKDVKAPNPKSLRQTVLDVIKAKTLTRKELADAVLKSGYKTKSRNTSNLLNPLLYGKDAILKNVDGKFTLK
jgi:hypothetical protein